MAIARRLKLGHDQVFPHGAYLVSEVTPVIDFDRSTRENRVQQIDEESGLLIWQVEALDADPEATKKTRTVVVKIFAKVQPVPPANEGPLPFPLVVFQDLVVTPWTDTSKCRPPEMGKAHRCGASQGWSLRASAMTAPGKQSQPAPPPNPSPTKAA